MAWAARRRLIITLIGGAVIFTVIALILIPTLYQSPSCSDGRQNQGEQGKDCGGPCAYLCTAHMQAPIVRFAKTVSPSANRVDVVAYVDNPNINSGARFVPYTVTLSTAGKTALKTVTGTLDLFPARRTPVFIPAVFTGDVSDTRASLTIDASAIKWFLYTSTPRLPSVGSPSIGGTTNAPRVTVALTNLGIYPLNTTKVVAVVYDSSANVIAASQTLVSNLAPQESTEATFTWGEAFSGIPARIEIELSPVFGS